MPSLLPFRRVSLMIFKFPFTYELKKNPRAIVEVEIHVPAPPASCFTQDHNASQPYLIFFVEEDLGTILAFHDLPPSCFLFLSPPSSFTRS